MKEVVIDARASAKKAEAHRAQSDDTPDTFNYEQAFSGFGRTSSGLGVAGDTYYGSPYAEEARPYTDTFIGIHHSPRGIRIAFQANSRTAVIVLIVLILLLSHPGVLDLLVNLLKQAINIH